MLARQPAKIDTTLMFKWDWMTSQSEISLMLVLVTRDKGRFRQSELVGMTLIRKISAREKQGT